MTGVSITDGPQSKTFSEAAIQAILNDGFAKLGNLFGGNSVEESFRIINTADSVKDGISIALSKKIYGTTGQVNADDIKGFMKDHFERLIEKGQMQRTSYHRVKSNVESDYVSVINCKKSFYDCGFDPNDIIINDAEDKKNHR